MFRASNQNVGADILSHYGRIVLLILFTLGCSSNNTPPTEDNVLAQINDHSVSVVHFENAFKEYFYRTGQVLTPTETTKKAILDSEFNTYVLAVFAEDIGLNTTAEAEYQRGAIRKRVLTEEFFKQVILDEVEVTDADLREYFIRFNSNLRASHIYAQTKEIADEYYTRIQKGESFEDLAKEAFTNTYLSQNGGDIGRFTTDDLDISFENQAFSMNVGDISMPIQTAQGYSIIKLTDRVTRPLITENEFNQSRDRLESYVWKKKEEMAQRSHLQNFTEQAVLDEQVVQSLFGVISTSGEGLYNKNPEFISRLEVDGEILKYDDFVFGYKQLTEELLISSVAMLNTIRDEISFKNFLLGIAYRSFMVEQVEELGIDQQPAVIASIEETYLHYLEELATQYLASSISNTPAELFSTFNLKRDDFYEPASIHVQRLVVKGEETAEKLSKELKEGADFSKFVLDYSIYNEDLFTEGDLGFIPLDDFGFNSRKISNIEIGSITEPMLYTADEYHIYKVIDRREARELSFDEARERVDNYLIREKLQQIRQQTIQEVKAKHNAVVDLEKLNALTIKI